MIPSRLTLCNFLSYRYSVALNFESFHLACLYGDNGTGKSSLLEAITWVLWGKARSSADALIHHGEEMMWVDFEFEQDGRKYRVIRKRSKKGRGSSELDFLVYDEGGWSSLSGATLKETEEKIAEIIRLPYEIFINSAYLRQGHTDEFTTKPPVQRKKILGEILELEVYENLSQKAKEIAKQDESEEEALSRSILEIEENLKQKPAFQKELKEAEGQLKKKEGLFNSEKTQLDSLQKAKNEYDLLAQKEELLSRQLAQIQKEGQRLKDEIEGLKGEISQARDLLKNEKTIKQKAAELKVLRQKDEEVQGKLLKLNRYQEELGRLKAERAEVEKKIAQIEKIDRCPTCLRPLSKKEAKEIIAGLRQSAEKEIFEKLKGVQDEIQKIDYQPEEHQKIKNQISQLLIFEEKEKELALVQQSLKEKKKILQKSQSELGQKRKQYSTILKQRTESSQKRVKLEPIHRQYQEQERKLSHLWEELLEAKATCGAFKQRLLDLSSQEALLQERRQKLEEIKRKRIVFEQLAGIFSKRGIQAMIIETLLPEIEEEANRILEKITDGRLQIRFITKKEKKSEEGETETLEILVSDNLGERSYEMYSGGEAFRIDLAIRVALSEVLSQRAGGKLQFLAIDEGFGSLDEAGKEEVVEAINALTEKFAKIIVVTHIPDLKNLFPFRIEVTKDENGSHLNLVSF